MGKCILAGHPPAGGQIGYGAYTGDWQADRFINLGVTPKWVLLFTSSGFTALSQTTLFGGLAIANAQPSTITLASNGFYVHCSGTNYAVGSNRGDYSYIYIFGT